jgi:hypothetical protein
MTYDYTSDGAVGALNSSFTDISSRLSVFAPRLVLALIVLVVGWLIALIIGNVLATIAQAIGLDALSRKIGLTRLLDSAGIEKSVSAIVGQIATWILVVVVLMAAAEVMGIDTVQIFLSAVLGYVPNVLGGAATLLIGLIFANFLADVVRHASQASGLNHTSVLSSVTRNAVVVFTVIAVLAQLGIASDIMRALIYGGIAMMTIAGGIAFGLGGQGVAKRGLEALEDELKPKKK